MERFWARIEKIFDRLTCVVQRARARERGEGGEGVTHCACDEGIGLGVDTPRDGYRV